MLELDFYRWMSVENPCGAPAYPLNFLSNDYIAHKFTNLSTPGG